MKRWRILFALTTVLALGGAASACPMCKDSISDTADAGNIDGRGQQDGLPSGFNTSVYLMLCAFLGTAGLMTFIVTRGILGANAAPARRGFQIKPTDSNR